jgi:recombination associated protein RdgC
MWFKNLQMYQLPKNWKMTGKELEVMIQKQIFAPCSKSDMESIGWVPPRENGDIVYSTGKQLLLMLRMEKKLLPGAVVNQFAKERAKEITDQQGFKPGRKQMKEIKEAMVDELLPQSFSLFSHTLVWIDPINGWLAIDSASTSKSDEVLRRLIEAVKEFPIESLNIAMSPTACMTNWLASEEAPQGFTIDQDTELRQLGEGKATIRYAHHSLETNDVRTHIAEGKICTRLAMTWNDKISFVLDERLIIKKISPLDILKDESDGSRDEEERFEADFTLMTGELNLLMNSIIEALGGIAKKT